MKILLSILASLMLAGCASTQTTEITQKVPLGNTGFDTEKAKVILIPMEGVSVQEVDLLASYIEARHKVRVRTYTTLGKNARMYNSDKQQFVAEEIAGAAGQALRDNGDANLDKAVIVLAKDDINTGDFRLRYVFSSHFDKARLSVISAARINPVNYGLPPDVELTRHRLVKLINKSLGLNLYGYPISTDRRSVMYGPIMSPDDLDGIGEWYELPTPPPATSSPTATLKATPSVSA